MAAIAYPVPAERRPNLVLVPPYEGPTHRTHRTISRRSTLRRRRVAVLAAIVLLVLAGQFAVHTASAWLGGGSLAASEPRSAAAPASAVYVVQPGDTLWTLARRAHPAGDLRPVVGRLAAALGDRPLRAGQRIVLP
ncbi:MAG: hypothetical protein QOE35_978 [Actinomycetota bacterium]|jgi:hypothetical protein